MNKRILYFAVIALLACGCNGCKDNKDSSEYITVSPDAGTTYKSGDPVSFSVKYPADVKPDSVVYVMDGKRVGSSNDSTAVTLKTDTLILGARVITAKVYHAGQAQEFTTNIVLLAAKAPEELTFKVEKVYGHDTSSYTEGLLFQDGYLYESDGGRVADGEGQSSLRKVDLATGKPVKKIDIDPKVFGEGISIVGDKIIQLTYTERKGFVYDKDTFKLLSTFENNVGIEGWGMTFDGKKLYMDDKTNRIFFLDKDTYRQTGYIDVYDDKGAVNQVNELEMIDGKLYANVYQTDDILVIDPKTGAVLQKIDMKALYPEASRNANADVLNGIAYDKVTNRIFVTGKKWDKLFQVKFVKK
ncbi:glutaminyl-peptide cyclotransferase [Mucilaginibacter gilvus]|uniref:Glutaminyl-peptide cyclotransferase n=1 Tax=Mucilaginibacter gilvus TaxID=2305909 RepID=A0A3S3Z8N0_9SPHI|nr:glutaminyl-peptide cyclotransferase [Mucilaginibacter gilvus]RWY55741.1 glutaminyl-peptide cyclotransferase [Mucilaginibacter gilvus]